VLLVMPLASSHLVTPVAALALVLGANLGSAINPVLEGGNARNPASRRLPIGNLINRVIGVVVVLPFLQPIADAFARFEPNPARMTADFHTAFNIALALVFILLLDAPGVAARASFARPGEINRLVDSALLGRDGN
jgi:phosphate:Na+ symporter